MSHFQSSQRILVFNNSHVGPTATVITSNQAEEQNARLTPPKKEEAQGWREQQRGRRRRRSNGRAVMRCVSDAFSGGAVLAAAPVNHDYNGEERRRRRCRKSCGDNYNARDKIMGTRRARPIIPCISSRVTSPPPRPPLLTTRNQGSRSPKPRRIHVEAAARDQTPLPGAAQVEGAA